MIKYTKKIIVLYIVLMFLPSNLKAAEKLSIEIGIFSRTIPIKDIEYLANTKKATSKLNKLIRLTKQSPEEISILLNEKFELPLVTTSKLMNSSIGEVIILRISEIIYPLKLRDSNIRMPAIRSAVTQGIVKGNGTLTIINFLKEYPNKTIAINVPALYKVINKVESISDLVKFFSNSPLEKMKKGKA